MRYVHLQMNENDQEKDEEEGQLPALIFKEKFFKIILSGRDS